MPAEPFFLNFAGQPGDLVRIYYANQIITKLGILVEQLESHPHRWTVVVEGQYFHLHQDSLELCR